jgi:hypothetical protein
MDPRYGAPQTYFGACRGPLGEVQNRPHTRSFVTSCPRSSGDRAPVS